MERGAAGRLRSSMSVRQVETKSPSYRVGSGQWMRNEVDLVEAEPLQRLVEGRAGVVGPVEAVVELGGDVELVAGDAGGRDRVADALLVAVHLRGVDVAVAGLEGLLDGPCGLLRRHLEHAEAELRDRRVVVEGHGRDSAWKRSCQGRQHDCATYSAGPPPRPVAWPALLDGRRASPANPGPARADRGPRDRLRRRLQLRPAVRERTRPPRPRLQLRPVYARYTHAPGVQLGPRCRRTLVDTLKNFDCSAGTQVVQDMLMQCDSDGTVFLIKDPITSGGVASAVAKQIDHEKLWFVRVALDPRRRATLAGADDRA